MRQIVQFFVAFSEKLNFTFRFLGQVAVVVNTMRNPSLSPYILSKNSDKPLKNRVPSLRIISVNW
jgi:hypothetical protein